MNEWSGEERRKSSDERLRMIELQVTRLVAHAESEQGNITLMIANIIKEQAEHKLDFKDHKKEDDLNFKRIDKTLGIYSGAIIAVVFIVRLIFK